MRFLCGPNVKYRYFNGHGAQPVGDPPVDSLETVPGLSGEEIGRVQKWGASE